MSQQIASSCSGRDRSPRPGRTAFCGPARKAEPRPAVAPLPGSISTRRPRPDRPSTVPPADPSDMCLDATVVAAAKPQSWRGRSTAEITHGSSFAGPAPALGPGNVTLFSDVPPYRWEHGTCRTLALRAATPIIGMRMRATGLLRSPHGTTDDFPAREIATQRFPAGQTALLVPVVAPRTMWPRRSRDTWVSWHGTRRSCTIWPKDNVYRKRLDPRRPAFFRASTRTCTASRWHRSYARNSRPRRQSCGSHSPPAREWSFGTSRAPSILYGAAGSR